MRVTEASPAAFSTKAAGADTGVRILVNLSGYGVGASVYVPDAIVGNDGTLPTTGGSVLDRRKRPARIRPGRISCC